MTDCTHDLAERETAVVAAATITQLRELQASLFDAIAHGDHEHRNWLKKAIADHFAGLPVEHPRGQGNTEQLRELVREVQKCRAADYVGEDWHTRARKLTGDGA